MLNRRQLLNATGLGAGTLFLPSLMTDRQAYAQDATKRLVIFYTQHGPSSENWNMRRPGLPAGGDFEFPLDGVPEAEYSTVLKPLYAHRKNLLVLEGMAITSAMSDNPAANNHNVGTSHMLTGAKIVRGSGFNGDGQGGGRSVDKIIADKVAVPGRIKSLFYSSMFAPFCPSFEGPNMPAAAEFSPQTAFTRLMFPAAGTLPPPVAATPTEADLIRKARPSVLDLVRARYTALGARLGGEDRKKLAAHQGLIADLELKLKALETPGAVATPVSCSPPARPTLTGDGGGGGKALAMNKAFTSLVTAAMSCDLTRVATLVSKPFDGPDFGAPNVDVHANIAHNSNSPTGMKQMGDYYKLHATEFADLIRQFEVAGLLQSSALVWVNELASGIHDLHRIMVVVAGSAGGAFTPGRYIRYRENGPNPAAFGFNGGNLPLGPAHSKFLVSLMQAMGLPNNSIGVTSAVGNNVLKGMPVDLTGPLPRLKV